MISLSELESFFAQWKPSGEEIRLSEHEVIIDPQKFVKSHLNALKGNPGNKTFLPYYDRIVKLYKILKK